MGVPALFQAYSSYGNAGYLTVSPQPLHFRGICADSRLRFGTFSIPVNAIGIDTFKGCKLIIGALEGYILKFCTAKVSPGHITPVEVDMAQLSPGEAGFFQV